MVECEKEKKKKQYEMRRRKKKKKSFLFYCSLPSFLVLSLYPSHTSSKKEREVCLIAKIISHNKTTLLMMTGRQKANIVIS